MIKTGIILLFAILFSQCVSSQKESENTCKINNEKSAELIYQFYEDNDSLHLDSALILINNSLGKCEEYEKLLSLRKLAILSMKKDYNNALTFIDKLELDFGNLPYYRKLLSYRFNAMQSLFIGDTSSGFDYLKKIIIEIDNYLLLNKSSADSLWKLTNLSLILKSPLSTALTQQYYYRSILEGKNNVKNELIAIQTKNGGNKDYIETIISALDDDFMIYNGL